jgi:nucleotide-binding universal stress UspA family protein
MAPIQSGREPANASVLDKQATSKLSIRNVLYATDFSPTSESALPYVAAICRRFGSALHVVHVFSDVNMFYLAGGVDYVSMGEVCDEADRAAHEKLDRVTGRLEGIPHRNYVRHGKVWENLAPLIEQNGVDLIVLGTHGRTGLGKLLLGSVAENILRHASCPVLTVGPRLSGRAKLPAIPAEGHDLPPLEVNCHQILAATNFLKNAKVLTKDAVSLAEEFRSRFTLLHVIEDYTEIGTQPAPLEEASRRLQALLPEHFDLPNPPETLIEFGSPPEQILRIAGEREADLIVLGARTHTGVGSTHMPWSTAHDVIAHAHCPVLTLRA